MKKTKSLAALALSVAVVATACGSSKKAAAPASTAAATTTAAAAAAVTTAATAAGGDSVANGAIKCTQQYKGKTVHIFAPLRNSDADPNTIKDYTAAYDAFTKCTGLTIVIDGTDQFESQAKVLLAGGNPPDVLDFPQPGLLANAANKGQLKPLPDAVAAHVKSDYIAGWDGYSSAGGKVYGIPGRVNIKSMVWYSPADFKAKGYAIPTTLDEMKTLSDKIAADGGTPWCAGIESGTATGWPVTDWFEDGMLRFNTPEDYDAWVAGTLKFSDPKVVKVADWVGSYLKNPKYLGGDNAVKAIATTKFQSGGLPILDHKCYMHRQASFYSGNWPKGTKIGADGAVNFFYLPVAKAGDKKVMLGAGDIYAAGTDKPETYDTLLFTGSSDYITALDAKPGRSDLSARKDFDTSKIADPLTKGFGDLLKSSEVFRFDGSDLMPSAVGTGTFWTEATKWIVGGSTTDMLANIDKSWPAS